MKTPEIDSLLLGTHEQNVKDVANAIRLARLEGYEEAIEDVKKEYYDYDDELGFSQTHGYILFGQILENMKLKYTEDNKEGKDE